MPVPNTRPDLIEEFRALQKKVQQLGSGNSMVKQRISGNTLISTMPLSADEVLLVNAPTSGSGANVYVDPVSGQLFRSVSSIRYKEQVIDLPAGLASQLIQLVPRAFKMKNDPEGPWHVGFIAEEAEELGLSHWVVYDEEGQPESFEYGLWSAAVQLMIRLLWNHIQENEQDIVAFAGNLVEEVAQLNQDLATLRDQANAAITQLRVDATGGHNAQQAAIDALTARVAALEAGG